MKKTEELKIVSIRVESNVYSDQTNVAVFVLLSNDSEWEVQTNKNGRYSAQDGCEIWIDEDKDCDPKDFPGYEIVITAAEKLAKAIQEQIR